MPLTSIAHRSLLSLALVTASILLAAPDAKAAPITFSTSGVFTCSGCAGSGTNAVTFLGGRGNAFMLVFTGLGSTSLDTPTATSFGNFQTFFSGTGVIAASGTFALTITQTAPTPGSAVFSSTLAGVFEASNSGSGVVNFTTTSVAIDGVVYNVTNSPLVLVPPSSNNGITPVLGQITTPAAPPVPEPTTMALFGCGLAGLGAMRRRGTARR